MSKASQRVLTPPAAPFGLGGVGALGAMCPRAAGPGHRFSIASSAGEAMKIEEKVPTTTPNNIRSAKGRTTHPRAAASASKLPSAVVPVKTVRGRVSFIDRLSIALNWSRLAQVQVLPDPVEDHDGIVQ